MKSPKFYQYKSWFCGCGKEIRYLSQKQLNFLKIMHNSSRKHQKIYGMDFGELISNEEFEKALQEILQ